MAHSLGMPAVQLGVRKLKPLVFVLQLHQWGMFLCRLYNPVLFPRRHQERLQTRNAKRMFGKCGCGLVCGSGGVLYPVLCVLIVSGGR